MNLGYEEVNWSKYKQKCFKALHTLYDFKALLRDTAPTRLTYYLSLYLHCLHKIFSTQTRNSGEDDKVSFHHLSPGIFFQIDVEQYPIQRCK